MGKQRWLLALISFVVIGAIAVLMFVPARLGLDLQGGAQLTIQVKPTAEIQKISPQDLEAVQRVLDNRINALGVSEPLIQTAGNDKIIVQLPGVSDPQQAERVLGGTADLEFREQKPGTEAQFRAEREVQSALLQKLEELK
ncbi:MAG: protein translocase subunit SecD, partial [Synechococcales cyanobacterium]